MTVATPLPVELLDFSGKAMENGVLLTWKTATELDNEGFHVERSDNGLQWTELGFVPGNGTTQVEREYSFTDGKPLPGVNYYRLRQVDFDGRFKHSPLVSVQVAHLQDLSTLQFVPNPARQGVTSLFVPATHEAESLLEIFDGMGRKVFHQKLKLEEFTPISRGGGSLSIPVDLSSRPAGVYFARLEVGGKAHVERLVVAE